MHYEFCFIMRIMIKSSWVTLRITDSGIAFFSLFLSYDYGFIRLAKSFPHKFSIFPGNTKYLFVSSSEFQENMTLFSFFLFIHLILGTVWSIIAPLLFLIFLRPKYNQCQFHLLVFLERLLRYEFGFFASSKNQNYFLLMKWHICMPSR